MNHDHVAGPYHDVTNNRWRIYLQSDGKRRKKIFKSREEAEAFKRSLQPREPAATTPRSVPPCDGTGAWWGHRLGELATELMSRPGDEELRRDCRTLATLAGAAKDYLDLAELERKVKEHTHLFEQITGAAKEGTRLPASFDEN